MMGETLGQVREAIDSLVRVAEAIDVHEEHRNDGKRFDIANCVICKEADKLYIARYAEGNVGLVNARKAAKELMAKLTGGDNGR